MKSEHLTFWSQPEPISHTILLQLFFLYAKNIARILFRVLFLYSNHSLKAPLLCSPLRVLIFLKILCLCPTPTLKRIPSDFFMYSHGFSHHWGLPSTCVYKPKLSSETCLYQDVLQAFPRLSSLGLKLIILFQSPLKPPKLCHSIPSTVL